MVLHPKLMRAFYSNMEKIFREKGIIAGKSGRHMKFPYTISAKIAQFPFFYYFQNNYIWMYYPPGFVIAFYVFTKIHVAANSEANQRNWAETQRKAAEKEHH